MKKVGGSAFGVFVVLFLTFQVVSAATITLGVVTKPGASQNVCAEKFKEVLEGFSVHKVQILHSASLGTETEILKKIQKNMVHMGIITAGPFDGFVPEVSVIDYPFLFRDSVQADEVLDGPLGQELLGGLEKANFKGFGFAENGFRNLTNSVRPVREARDVRGLKIRVVESELHRELWTILGATTVPLGWPVNDQLKRGLVDGQENPLSVIWEYKLYEVQKYLSLTGHVYSAHIAVANLDWFKALSPKDQRLIEDSIREAVRHQRKWNRDRVAGFLTKLKETGMVVEENPDISSFRLAASRKEDYQIFNPRETRKLLEKFIKATGE
jgi:tripartite ATP-independent transporter DctP family solute receptor